jgi:ribonuclease P protein component
MRRDMRLRRTSDFDRVRASGRRSANSLLVGYVFARGDSDPTRIGITVGKRTGNAVVRNRIKRRLREAVRLAYPTLALGLDVVLIARPSIVPVSVGTLRGAAHEVLSRLTAPRLGSTPPPGEVSS